MVEQSVRAAYSASVAAGAALSQRAMAERFGLSRCKVAQLVTAASVQANGQAPRGNAAAQPITFSDTSHAHRSLSTQGYTGFGVPI